MNKTNYILTPEGNFISIDELYHHGIKGQKWGIRRYQNPDGTLTAAGKKKQAKAAKEYEKEMIAYGRDAVKNATALNVKAYNKTADEYNNGKIAEYNRTHDPKSETYYDDYNKQFEQDYRRNFDKMRLSELENNKHYQKAQKLVSDYNLLEVSELARKDADFVTNLKKKMSEGKTSWDD